MFVMELKKRISIIFGFLLIVLTQYLCISDPYYKKLNNIEIGTFILLMDICLMLIVYSFIFRARNNKYAIIFVISPVTFIMECLNEKMSILNTVVLVVITIICFIHLFFYRDKGGA